MELPRIEISTKHKRALADKYGVSTQHVRNSLKYYSGSETSKSIRKDAIELLRLEAEKANINEG